MLLQMAGFHSFLWLTSIYIYILYPFIHQWTPGCFHVWAIANNAVMYICLFESLFLCSLDKYPEVELLDHSIVGLFLIF